jgi:ANTAR domain
VLQVPRTVKNLSSRSLNVHVLSPALSRSNPANSLTHDKERALAASELLATQLQTALTSRVQLEQTKGMLAQRTGLPMVQVFELMRDYARHSGHRLSDVAAHILDGTLEEDLLRQQRKPGTPPGMTGLPRPWRLAPVRRCGSGYRSSSTPTSGCTANVCTWSMAARRACFSGAMSRASWARSVPPWWAESRR